MMSKSANYCYAHLSDNTGLLLLCEVAAKPFYERVHAEYNADQGCKAAGARATKGLGRTHPGAWQDAGDALEHPGLKGVQMPKGPVVNNGRSDASLQYNEVRGAFVLAVLWRLMQFGRSILCMIPRRSG